MLKKKQTINGLAASVADGYLILSLPHAIDPVIWRQSLDKIDSATFEVKSGTKNQFSLVLKKTKTSSETIATFTDKADAIDALNAASTALHSKKTTITQKAESNEIVKNNTTAEAPTGEGKKWFVALFAALILIGLYYYLTTLIPQRTILADGQRAPLNSAQSNSPSDTGVPVSADDYLSSFQ